MYTMFQTGGKQYRAVPGEILQVEKLPCVPGQVLEWAGKRISDTGIEVVIIRGEAIEVRKAPKVIIFKKQKRQNHRRKRGHRQQLLRVRITEVVAA